MSAIFLVLPPSAAAWLPPPPTAIRPLVVFRPRSRHTYGFDSASSKTFDLPHAELSSLIDSSSKFRLTIPEEDDAEEAQIAWVRSSQGQGEQALSGAC